MEGSMTGEPVIEKRVGDLPPTAPEPHLVPDHKEELKEKKKKLETKLASGSYRTLAGIILDSTGAVVQKLLGLKSPVSFLISAGVLAVLIYLIGRGISLLLGETPSTELIQLSAWASAMGALALIVNQVMIHMFLDVFHGCPVESLVSHKDLDDLETWLDKNFDFKLPLVVSILLGPILGIFLLSEWTNSNRLPLYIGPQFIAIISATEAVIAIYYLFPFYLVLPARLSHYGFDMFKADPSSSEVTKRLSDLFTVIMYLTIALVVLVTASFGYFKILTQQTVLFLGIFVWAPTVVLYLGCQYNLSRIITNTKWKTLNEIQAEIEALLASQATPTKETLDLIEKLMNYHDRIRDTPNSSLNFRSGLNALNSILLPLVALIFTNWDTIKGILSGIGLQVK